MSAANQANAAPVEKSAPATTPAPAPVVNAWSNKNSAVGNGAPTQPAKVGSDKPAAGGPQKSVLSAAAGLKPPPRTESAPPAMPAGHQKTSKKKKSKGGGNMAMNNALAAAPAFVPQGGFYPPQGGFYPQQGMPYDQGMMHPGPHAGMGRQGNGNGGGGNSRKGKGNRSRANSGSKKNYHNQQQQQQQQHGFSNQSQMAYHHQQQMYQQQFMMQQQMMYGPRPGFGPPAFQGGYAPPYVPQGGYHNFPNPATTPSWTPPSAGQDASNVGSTTADPAVTAAPVQLAPRKRQPLKILDKDGNPLVIKPADTEKPPTKEEESPSTDEGNPQVSPATTAAAAKSAAANYSIEDLRAIRDSLREKGEIKAPAFLAEVSFEVDTPEARDVPGRFSSFGGFRSSAGMRTGSRQAGSAYSNISGAANFAAANKRPIGQKALPSAKAGGTWARGQAAPTPQAPAIDEQKRRHQEEQEKAFAKLREDRAQGKATWKKEELTDPVAKAKAQAQGFLNKLTKDKFDLIFERFKTDIDMSEGVVVVEAVVDMIFDKALGEHCFTDIYAQLCQKFSKEFEFFSKQFLTVDGGESDGGYFWVGGKGLARCGQSVDDDGNVIPFKTEDEARVKGQKQTHFKRVLLNKCQKEFEDGQRQADVNESISKLEADATMEPKEKKLKLFEYEELRKKIKKRAIGNVLFIGWLFKRRLLTEKIMHECISTLMRGEGSSDSTGGMSDEENVEALCKLFETIGNTLEEKGKQKPETRQALNEYFGILQSVAKSSKSSLSNRVKFMILDLVDLRSNNWVPRRKKETSKTKEEVRKEALREEAVKQAEAARHNNRDNRGRGGPQVARGGNNRNPNPNQLRGREQRQPNRSAPPVGDFPKNLTFPAFRGPGGGGRPGGGLMGGGRPGTLKPTPAGAAPGMKSGAAESKPLIRGRGNPALSMSEDDVKTECRMIIKEFIGIENRVEAQECMDAIPANSKKESLFIETCFDVMIDEKEANRKKIFVLVRIFAESKALTDEHFIHGLKPLCEFLDDVVMDCPLAAVWLGQTLAAGRVSKGALDQFFELTNDKHHDNIKKGLNNA